MSGLFPRSMTELLSLLSLQCGILVAFAVMILVIKMCSQLKKYQQGSEARHCTVQNVKELCGVLISKQS